MPPQFSPAIDYPGGCYTWRYFGERRDPAVWCAKPGGEQIRSQAERGCAFWEGETGADAGLYLRGPGRSILIAVPAVVLFEAHKKEETMKKTSLSHWFGLCLAFVVSNAAAAVNNYAVMSLLGDRLTFIVSEKQVGSHLDLNDKEVVTVKDRSLDDFASRVADAAIEKARPSASVTMLRANDPALYALRNSWLDTEGGDVKTLASIVLKFVSSSSDAHLLLIAPYRAELELKSDRGYPFTGSKIAGLGFYSGVGNQASSGSYATKQVTPAFLGVFANFQLLLINLQTGAIEGHERVVVGDTFPADALSPTQKVEALRDLMQREIDRAVPAMLAVN